MKSKTEYLKKAAAAVALILLSALASLLIKETLDSFDPENALPQIQVSAGWTVPEVRRAGYEWSFLTTVKRSPIVSPPDLPLAVVDAPPQTPIVINFSTAYQSLTVSRADGLNSTDYIPISGEVRTPIQPGIYVYKVEAQFKRGTIVYYFALEVRNEQPVA